MRRCGVGFWLALVCVVAFPLRAEEGRIPLFEPTVLDGSAGDISGRYVVTRNIVSGTRVFEIIGTGTEEIEIDLNGFLLEGATGGMLIRDVRKLKLSNGKLRNAGNGTVEIYSLGAEIETVIIEDLTIEGGTACIGIGSTADTTVRRVDCRDPTGGARGGILIDGAGVTDGRAIVEDSLIRDSAGRGIFTSSLANVTLTGNRILNANIGILAGGNGVVITDNTVESITGNAGLLILGNENLFGRNAARGNSGTPVCSTPPPGPGCASPNFCDSGIGNSSLGDNRMPGPPPC
ncbi:MAG: right-handed parallel beta-helix repeat-containing protein [bacterium]|nr:right-handed parallel beta-helix repeat-containing protein [bacterium]